MVFSLTSDHFYTFFHVSDIVLRAADSSWILKINSKDGLFGTYLV